MEPPRFAETVNVSEIVRRAPEDRELAERRAVSPVGEGVREEVQEVGEGNKEMHVQENDRVAPDSLAGSWDLDPSRTNSLSRGTLAASPVDMIGTTGSSPTLRVRLVWTVDSPGYRDEMPLRLITT
mmetsp:Transcript_31633/g.50807  ORF Transcript_31633/g.50807 Transcript_31633/m.50807 type:complete len:126 (-) Transcript_31633:290-667(-)